MRDGSQFRPAKILSASTRGARPAASGFRCLRRCTPIRASDPSRHCLGPDPHRPTLIDREVPERTNPGVGWYPSGIPDVQSGHKVQAAPPSRAPANDRSSRTMRCASPPVTSGSAVKYITGHTKLYPPYEPVKKACFQTLCPTLSALLPLLPISATRNPYRLLPPAGRFGGTQASRACQAGLLTGASSRTRMSRPWQRLPRLLNRPGTALSPVLGCSEPFWAATARKRAEPI